VEVTDDHLWHLADLTFVPAEAGREKATLEGVEVVRENGRYRRISLEEVSVFAKAIGAGRSGDTAAAREQQQRLLALRDAAKEAKLGYWAEQIDIQADIAGNLALCAEGKSDACIEEMRKAAAREDATEKHVVTPGPIIPARELLADLLLASGKAGEALQEYEAVLNKEPNRYRAVLGAARAASRAANESRARDLFKQLNAGHARRSDGCYCRTARRRRYADARRAPRPPCA
jgi:hypothetical protein